VLNLKRPCLTYSRFHQAFFASTWGPIAWVVIGEIFPLNVRAKGIALSAASNWLWNWAIAYATPFLVNPGPGNADLGSKVFFIWGSTCVGCLIFTYFCIPETKGLSLEQVDIMYQNTTPIKSPAYRRQLIANDVHAADHEAIARVSSKVDSESRLGGILGTRRSNDLEKGSHEDEKRM
jgi:SP family sugar:H+ symporter-like MFS transporter